MSYSLVLPPPVRTALPAGFCCIIRSSPGLSENKVIVALDGNILVIFLIKPALFGFFFLGKFPTEEEIKEYLTGNLCRCSGYEGQLRGIQNFLAWKKAKQEGAE